MLIAFVLQLGRFVLIDLFCFPGFAGTTLWQVRRPKRKSEPLTLIVNEASGHKIDRERSVLVDGLPCAIYLCRVLRVLPGMRTAA